MSFPRAFGASLLVASSMMGAACTGGAASPPETGDTPGAASADTSRAIPQAIFDGRLEKGSDDDCPDTGPLFAAGTFGSPSTESPSRPVKDGESFAQGTASVTCSVTPAGSDAFDLSGEIELSGPTGGLFRIDGRIKATGEQTGIHAVFANRTSGNTYEQTDRACTVRYTTSFQGVAPGRVWGEVTCPKAENAGAQTSCEAIAQFRFENCTQE